MERQRPSHLAVGHDRRSLHAAPGAKDGDSALVQLEPQPGHARLLRLRVGHGGELSQSEATLGSSWTASGRPLVPRRRRGVARAVLVVRQPPDSRWERSERTRAPGIRVRQRPRQRARYSLRASWCVDACWWELAGSLGGDASNERRALPSHEAGSDYLLSSSEIRNRSSDATVSLGVALRGRWGIVRVTFAYQRSLSFTSRELPLAGGPATPTRLR